MAFLQNDDEQNKQNSQQGQQPLVGAGGSFVGGGGAGSNVSRGTGGMQQPFVNMQDYVKANAGTDSSQGISSPIQSDIANAESGLNSAYGNYRSNLVSGYNDYMGKESAAQNAVGTERNALSKLGPQDIAKFNPNADSDFGRTQALAQTAYGSQYQQPGAFNYALPSTTQNYGASLQTPESFRNYTQGEYSKAGLTPGAGLLQAQLDASNPNMESTRQKLLTQYAGLSPEIQTKTNELGGMGNQFNTEATVARQKTGVQSNKLSSDLSGYQGALTNNGYDNMGNQLAPGASGQHFSLLDLLNRTQPYANTTGSNDAAVYSKINAAINGYKNQYGF